MRLRTTTGLRTTARLRTTTTVFSTVASALPTEVVASAPGAIIGPAANVSELASASPATRPAANSNVCVVFIICFFLFEDCASGDTLRMMSG
jgi:hypothetical protein